MNFNFISQAKNLVMTTIWDDPGYNESKKNDDLKSKDDEHPTNNIKKISEKTNKDKIQGELENKRKIEESRKELNKQSEKLRIKQIQKDEKWFNELLQEKAQNMIKNHIDMEIYQNKLIKKISIMEEIVSRTRLHQDLCKMYKPVFDLLIIPVKIEFGQLIDQENPTKIVNLISLMEDVFEKENIDYNLRIWPISVHILNIETNLKGSLELSLENPKTNWSTCSVIKKNNDNKLNTIISDKKKEQENQVFSFIGRLNQTDLLAKFYHSLNILPEYSSEKKPEWPYSEIIRTKLWGLYIIGKDMKKLFKLKEQHKSQPQIVLWKKNLESEIIMYTLLDSYLSNDLRTSIMRIIEDSDDEYYKLFKTTLDMIEKFTGKYSKTMTFSSFKLSLRHFDKDHFIIYNKLVNASSKENYKLEFTLMISYRCIQSELKKEGCNTKENKNE